MKLAKIEMGQDLFMPDVDLRQKIIPVIEKNHCFVITSHSNPDCDALGSELALAEHLSKLGKEAVIINNDPVPAAFRFLDSQSGGTIKKYSRRKHLTIIAESDVIVVLDASGGWERIGRVGKVFEQAKAIKICLDHHPDSTDFVDVAVVDTNAAATAELIYGLIVMMDGQVSAPMAQALYAAIMTDTGSFRFPKTSPRTHRIAAHLLAAGADATYIYRQIYEQYPLGRVRLKGHVIDSIKTEADGQIAYYGLDRNTLKAYGVKASELDGFASLGQEIAGVRVTIFCLESNDNRVKISLRSDGTLAINQVALDYNGGGHPSAAGAIVEGKLDEVLAEITEKVNALFQIKEH
jgi:phosphoesterase RecJ-like protein